MQAFPPPGEGGKIGSAADAEVEKLITTARQDKKAAQIVGRDKLLDTISKGSSKRSRPDITGGGGRNRPTVTGGGQRPSDTQSSLRQMNIDGTFDEPKQTKTKKPRTKKQIEGSKKAKQTRAANAKKKLEAGGQQTIDFDQFVDKAKKQVQDIKKQPVGQTVKQAVTRTFLTKDKGVRGLVGKAINNPVGTAIAAGVARDSFRNPLPQLQVPTVKGGKVGRRTAG